MTQEKNEKKTDKDVKEKRETNRTLQGTDKDPEAEKQETEPVQKEDLTGKKVDADLSREEDRPASN